MHSGSSAREALGEEGEQLTAITPWASGLPTVPHSRTFPLNETWLSAHVGTGSWLLALREMWVSIGGGHSPPIRASFPCK